jgi:hypothetical protein
MQCAGARATHCPCTCRPCRSVVGPLLPSTGPNLCTALSFPRTAPSLCANFFRCSAVPDRLLRRRIRSLPLESVQGPRSSALRPLPAHQHLHSPHGARLAAGQADSTAHGGIIAAGLLEVCSCQCLVQAVTLAAGRLALACPTGALRRLRALPCSFTACVRRRHVTASQLLSRCCSA